MYNLQNSTVWANKKQRTFNDNRGSSTHPDSRQLPRRCATGLHSCGTQVPYGLLDTHKCRQEPCSLCCLLGCTVTDNCGTQLRRGTETLHRLWWKRSNMKSFAFFFMKGSLTTRSSDENSQTSKLSSDTDSHTKLMFCSVIWELPCRFSRALCCLEEHPLIAFRICILYCRPPIQLVKYPLPYGVSTPARIHFNQWSAFSQYGF